MKKYCFTVNLRGLIIYKKEAGSMGAVANSDAFFWILHSNIFRENEHSKRWGLFRPQRKILPTF